jgi:hypothetical protein
VLIDGGRAEFVKQLSIINNGSLAYLPYKFTHFPDIKERKSAKPVNIYRQ